MKNGLLSKAEAKIEEYKHLVGEIPDQAVADICGISSTTVLLYRQRRGIPPQQVFDRINRYKIPVPQSESKKCKCGKLGTNRFQGEYICDDCLNPPIEADELERHVYSGRSPSCCTE